MSRHVVTGATSGMGAAVVDRLVARGDEVVLVARDESRADALRSSYDGAQVVVGDLADPGTLNGLGRQVDGPVHSLLHVAGTVELGSVARLRLQDWEQQLAVNLLAPAVLTRELLPHLREARGTVVFVNSTSGLSASAQWSGYAASKFGLRALADVLRAEEAEHGVRVTSLYPSRTATPMQEKVHAQEGRDYDPAEWISVDSVADAVLHVVDLPRDATITDLTVRPGPGLGR